MLGIVASLSFLLMMFNVLFLVERPLTPSEEPLAILIGPYAASLADGRLTLLQAFFDLGMEVFSLLGQTFSTCHLDARWFILFTKLIPQIPSETLMSLSALFPFDQRRTFS